MLTRPYLNLIQKSVEEDGVKFEEISENYLYKAIRGNQSFLMHDVEVGLNNASSQKIAMSKCGTYDVLNHAKIPAIKHVFLMNHKSRFTTNDDYELARKLFKKWNNHVVVKQDDGSQGRNVYQISNEPTLINCLNELFSLNVHAAISPFYEASYEYRVATLLGEPKIFLAKERTSSSWKHNLICGAISKEVEQRMIPDLARLAKNAATSLELDFCTVDILETKNGLFVLEVNEQVMLDEYCKNNHRRKQQVSDLYREAILERFQRL